MGRAPALADKALVIATLALVMALTLVLLLFAGKVFRVLGVTGTNVVGRVLGILLAALAVQLVLDGLSASVLH
jgi:multiple antibiotic resistance protein